MLVRRKMMITKFTNYINYVEKILQKLLQSIVFAFVCDTQCSIWLRTTNKPKWRRKRQPYKQRTSRGNGCHKGTSNSTQTDASGSFSISASPEQTLVFSFVGYETKETLAGQSPTMNVELIASDNVLDELVVVGYGSQRRSDITGSV